MAAGFHQPVFQCPAAGHTLLKIQVAAGDAWAQHGAHDTQQGAFVQRSRIEKQGTGKTQGIGHEAARIILNVD